MTRKLLSVDDFRDAARAGGTPDGMVLRLAAGDSEQVGEDTARTQRFVFSDERVDLSGDSIKPKGWELGDFENNPVALFSHMSWEPPIGRASNVSVKNGKLVGDIEFASADIYPFADTIYRLVKNKFLKAVSVGFKPLEWTFVNDKDRPYGIDFVRQALLEISVCCVPCNPNALTEARSMGIDTRPLRDWAERVLDEGETIRMPRSQLEEIFKASHTPHSVRDRYKHLLVAPKAADWKCGASRDLPIDDSDSWDGAAAEASIFEHAGGDDFDPAKAKLGFLAYDGSKPKERGSYKEPFAHVVNGELKAAPGGIRAAASRLPQTDIPDSVKETARGVLDHYEAEMKKSKAMGEGSGDGAVVPPGNCGRAKDMECGMKDPAECSIHAPETKAADTINKAGRRLSAKTKAALNQAMQHHEAGMKCIKDIMDEDAADGDPDDDGDGEPAKPIDVSDSLDPAAQRRADVAALRALLNN